MTEDEKPIETEVEKDEPEYASIDDLTKRDEDTWEEDFPFTLSSGKTVLIRLRKISAKEDVLLQGKATDQMRGFHNAKYQMLLVKKSIVKPKLSDEEFDKMMDNTSGLFAALIARISLFGTDTLPEIIESEKNSGGPT